MNLRRPNKPFKPRKDDILRLRKEGKSFKQIAKILGCSISTISYHCGKNKSEKKRVLEAGQRAGYDLAKKINNFKAKCSKAQWRIFRTKIKGFKKKKPASEKKRKATTVWRVHNISIPYTTEDVVNKIGATPVCYLTGRKIELNKTTEYSLDHRVPTARGGTNDLENLEVCCTVVNRAKTDLTLEEFYTLCEEVLAWRDKNAKL